MMRRALASSTYLLCAAALLAGCGSGGSKSTSTGTTTGAATLTITTLTGPASTFPPQSALEICQRLIAEASTMSPKLKARIESVCEQGASGGNANRARLAAKQACIELIEARTNLTEQKRKFNLENCAVV